MLKSQVRPRPWSAAPRYQALAVRRDQGATRTFFRGIVGIQKQSGVAHGGLRRTHQALAVHRDSGVKDDIPTWQTLRFSEAYQPKTLNPKP